MSEILYPNREDFELFIHIITQKRYSISRFLPKISTDWFDLICECVNYVHTTSTYEKHVDLHECAARLIYKVAKRHELADGNKRSAVMVAYLFYMLNDHVVVRPNVVKDQAKRAARSKGRNNEELIRRRIADVLRQTVIPYVKKTG